MSLPPPIRKSAPLICYVTDRVQLAASADAQKNSLIEKMSVAAGAGIDWIQIREKDLSAKELSELVREALGRVLSACRILINDRLDLACAVRAGGVHLGEKSISVEQAKRFASERGLPDDFLIGASVHSLEAARAAQAAGADYLIFGPIFATPSKAVFGPPQGLERLAAVSRSVSIPVLGIGGITPQNAGECYARGAAGVAAIRLFQQAPFLAEVVAELRRA